MFCRCKPLFTMSISFFECSDRASQRDRQSQTYRQRSSDVGNPFYLLSLPLDRYPESLKPWNCSVSSTEKHQHKLKACRHTSTTAQTSYLPRGRSCDPMTRVLSKISCFLQCRPHSVSNSTTYWVPREWTGTETAWDGGCVRSAISPLFSSPLLLPSPTLFLPPSPSPFPSVSEWLRLGAGMCVILLLLVCLNGLVWPCGEHQIYTRIQTRLSQTQTPPTYHTFPTELRPPQGKFSCWN